ASKCSRLRPTESIVTWQPAQPGIVECCESRSRAVISPVGSGGILTPAGGESGSGWQRRRGGTESPRFVGEGGEAGAWTGVDTAWAGEPGRRPRGRGHGSEAAAGGRGHAVESGELRVHEGVELVEDAPIVEVAPEHRIIEGQERLFLER